jgi:RNA polymerase-binding transcription factor DksA
MKKDELLRHLIENALDFLSHSIEELKESPKYSVIHFYAAVELFIKAHLMSEHWSLVVSKRQEPDWRKFRAGDFCSVSLKEAAERLDKVARSGLTKKEFDAFDAVAKHRNKMVHFYHEAHTGNLQKDEQRSTIARQQLSAWYSLHQLLTGRWNSVFKSWISEITAIDKRLREHRAFLQVIFDNKREEIEKREQTGDTFGTCPSCGYPAQLQQLQCDWVYEGKCLVCELVQVRLTIECPKCKTLVDFMDDGFATCDSCGKQFEPEDVVAVLTDGTPYREFIELGNCSDCDGFHTVVPIGDKYVCVRCLGVFESMQQCGWCMELNTGDMEGSFHFGCNHCAGNADEHEDD